MEEKAVTMQEMTTEEAIDWLKGYIQSEKKTQREVAQELGISTGLLSGFLAGTYSSPHTMIPKVQDLKEMNQGKKEVLTGPPFVETSVSRLVEAAIKYSHLQGRVTVAYGDAGIGKTQAFNHYLSTHERAIGITIMPTDASIAGVNDLLSDQLGIRERVARKITREIVSKLKGSGRVIVIDEAQHLTVRAIDHIRSIGDAAEIGVCFIGNEQVYKKLLGSEKDDFAQLFSRIGMRAPVWVDTFTREDVEKVFQAAGLQKDALDILYQICHTRYGLRGAVNVFTNTANTFQGDVNAGNIARMMRSLDIGR